MVTYINDRDTLERLVKLETKTDLKFSEHEKALVLAREAIDYRLRHLNDFQTRMDKSESMYATILELRVVKETLEKESKTAHESLQKQIASLTKFMFIAIGVIAAVEFFLKYLK